MKHSSKVEKFVKCISACESANAASAMANKKYKLNAASCDDQAAWNEAMDQLGWPFSAKNQ
jgi:hypothetical protein